MIPPVYKYRPVERRPAWRGTITAPAALNIARLGHTTRVYFPDWKIESRCVSGNNESLDSDAFRKILEQYRILICFIPKTV